MDLRDRIADLRDAGVTLHLECRCGKRLDTVTPELKGGFPRVRFRHAERQDSRTSHVWIDPATVCEEGSRNPFGVARSSHYGWRCKRCLNTHAFRMETVGDAFLTVADAGRDTIVIGVDL